MKFDLSSPICIPDSWRQARNVPGNHKSFTWPSYPIRPVPFKVNTSSCCSKVIMSGVNGNVMYGNPGRPCKRKVKEKEVKRIVEFAKGKYRGFNDHHLTEQLREQKRSSYRGRRSAGFIVLMGSHLPERNVRQHRSRRQRKEAEGMMLQVDGSAHDWTLQWIEKSNGKVHRYSRNDRTLREIECRRNPWGQRFSPWEFVRRVRQKPF